MRLKSGISSTSDVSDADVTSHIAYADAEIDETTRQSYDNASSETEYHNVYLPKRADDIEPNRILLGKYPIQSITSFVLLDSTGTASATLDTLSAAEVTAGTYISDDYYCDVKIGSIELISRAFEFVPRKAKITYTQGYSSVPVIVEELSATLTAIRIWVQFLGGNYDKVNNYKLAEQSFDRGSFENRGLQTIATLTTKAEDLFNQLGKKQRSQMQISSGGYF